MPGSLSCIKSKNLPAKIRRASVWILSVILSLFFFGTLLAATTNYTVRGIIQQVDLPAHQLVIAHESIPGFMDAMTMPFNVRGELAPLDLAAGTAIEFQFHVNESESWIDGVKKIAADSLNRAAQTSSDHSAPEAVPVSASQNQTNLGHFKFTNELGQSVSFSDFHGQAIALTFFFTRCPVPDFCPRLSRNFKEAQQELLSMKDAPTNWHLISVSFDTEHDTPEKLKAYAETYQYDSAHWTFLTGPPDKIAQLAARCNVQFTATNGSFIHNFRTIIIDASNHLQMVFPSGGDLSKSIVQQLLKAAHPAETDSKLGAKN
jgi:protein SCO1/2